MTATNSINAYHSHIKGKVDNSQNKMVLDYIRLSGSCSIRMLHKFILERGEFIELVSLRRSVHDLTFPNKKTGRFNNEWGIAKLRVEKDDLCRITGVRVGYYMAIDVVQKLNIF